MRLGSLPIWLAGGRDDVLRETPADRTRYAATGGVILTTGAVAAASATFALLMAVRLPLAACVLVGLGWGVVIVNLDRLLITSMARRRGWWRSLVTALPRVALAVLLGAVISTPLVLQIFDPEIQSEMLVLQAQRKAAFEEHLRTDPRYTGLPALRQQLETQQNIANGSVAESVDNDPAVKAAQADVSAKLGAVDAAQRELNGELDGTGGTRVPGVGAASRAKQQALDTAKQLLAQSQDNLRRAIASAGSSAGGKAKTAADQVPGLQKQVDDFQHAQDVERASYSDSQVASSGLLARIEALDVLRQDRPALATAQFVLFLLFMTLELLPVIVKLLQLTGPESVYEVMMRELATDALRAAAIQRARDRESADAVRERRLQLDLDWTERQFDEGLRANEEVMTRQRAIVERSIADWSKRASAQSTRHLAGFDTLFRRRDREYDDDIDVSSTVPLPAHAALEDQPSLQDGVPGGPARGSRDW